MTIGLLLITHDQVGRTLLDTATQMLGICPLQTEILPVMPDSDPDVLAVAARALCDQLDRGEGVLVLTDIYGSTPSNIATRLIDGRRVEVVSGINLPMLVRVLNYHRLSLSELAHKAISGGRDGVLALSSCRGSPPDVAPAGDDQ
jgi:PTS system mannose-specific IIA component